MFFPDRKRRQINLGGSSHSSSAGVLTEAKLLRNERSSQKRRSDAALKVQHWWRGVLERRRVKQQLRARFQNDPQTLDGLRCLTLIGGGDAELQTWARGDVFQFQSSPSWIVLVPQLAVQLLEGVSKSPL